MAGLAFGILAMTTLLLPRPVPQGFTLGFAVAAVACFVMAALSKIDFAQPVRAPAQPGQARQGPGMFDGAGGWLAQHPWGIAGTISLVAAICVMFFGFGPDTFTNHVVATTLLLAVSVIFFMVEAGVLKNYLKPVLLALWLLFSVLAGFLVVQAADEEVLHVWNHPFIWYFILCCLSAVMAILAMTGKLGQAIEKVGEGLEWLFANFGKAIFFQHGSTLGFFLWLATSLFLMWATLEVSRGEFFFAFDLEPEKAEKLATGFGLLAFFSAIAFFMSLVPKKMKV